MTMAAALLLVASAISATVTATPPVVAAVVTLPSGFVDELVTTVPSPTALAFTPDGRTLITTQPGVLRVRTAAGTLVATPALNLSGKTCANRERGLLGVAVDPAFATNHFIYLYYTFNKFGNACPTTARRRLRSTACRASCCPTTNVVDPASEIVLIDNIPSSAGNHNAGDLQFGKDGNLYVSVGDGGCDYAGTSGCAAQNDASRDQHVLLGKILRITPTAGSRRTTPSRAPTPHAAT